MPIGEFPLQRYSIQSYKSVTCQQFSQGHIKHRKQKSLFLISMVCQYKKTMQKINQRVIWVNIKTEQLINA